MAENIEYRIPHSGKFRTDRNRNGDMPLQVQEKEGIPVIPAFDNGDQTSGGKRREQLAWHTLQPGLVWKFGRGDFFLRRGEIIYSRDVVALGKKPHQQSLWENSA